MNGTLQLRKLNRTEKICPGDLHDLYNSGNLFPVINMDSLGQTPESFSPDRQFYRIEGAIIVNKKDLTNS